jgi:O-antigen/teichoic acid export membrane protein
MLSNMAWSVLSRGVQALTGFLAFLAITRYLTVTQLGDYAYVMALAASVLSFSYFGLQQTVVRETAQNPADAASILGAGLSIRLILILVAAGAVWGYAATGADTAAMAGALILAGLAESFRSLGQLACAVFQAHERLKQEFLLSMVHALTWGVALCVVVVSDLGLHWVLAASVLALGVHSLLGWGLVWKDFVRPAFLSGLTRAWPMLKVSAVIGLAVVVVMNLFRVNVLMLSWFDTPEQTAFFQVPHDLMLKFQILFQATMLAAFPVLARLNATQETRRRLLGILHRIMGLGAIVLSLILCLCAEPLIMRLWGVKLTPSILPLQILAWSALPLALNILWSHALVAADGQRYTFLANAFALVINVAASLVLIPMADAVGAACAALLTYSAAAGFTLWFAVRLRLTPTRLIHIFLGHPSGSLKTLISEIRHPESLRQEEA